MNTSTPNVPFQSLLKFYGQQDKTQVLSYYSMLKDSSMHIACVEHSHLLTVNDLNRTTNQLNGRSAFQKDDLQTCRGTTRLGRLAIARSEIRLRAF